MLFSYMAALTTRLGFITGILILPQRATALVAKQAATLDVLSGGRFRLGVGIGWNKVEYVAQGYDFHTRGKRVEAQVALLKRLWTEPLVTVDDEWHHIDDAGLNPLPVQRPIPIWFGGHADPVLRRVAALGDGWLPNYRRPEQAQPSLDAIKRHCDELGRPFSEIGVEARMLLRHREYWDDLLKGWEQAGATHLSFNTMGAGLASPGEHIAAVREFAEYAGVGQ